MYNLLVTEKKEIILIVDCSHKLSLGILLNIDTSFLSLMFLTCQWVSLANLTPNVYIVITTFIMMTDLIRTTNNYVSRFGLLYAWEIESDVGTNKIVFEYFL
jgi:hypothetical protein